ncbi:MAG: dihydrodipicolinate synthase family protein [bacterium]
MRLAGIYIPVTTPFVDNRIAIEKLAFNLEKWNAYDLDGYVILGSTGEAVYLSQPEKLELVKTARKYIPREKKMIVGTGLESTVATIEFTNRVSELGVDCALVLTPNYYKNQMQDEHLLYHFNSVADKSSLPVILYNVPKFTKIDLSSAVIKQLSSHANIIGIKDSTSNLTKLMELVKIEATNFSLLIGNASNYLCGLLMGAQGAILALCNIAPKECGQIYRLYNNKSYEDARQLFLKVLPLATNIIASFGIPAIKAALDLLGYYGGKPRPPLLPLSTNLLPEIRQHLIDAELL